ncbi:MAG: nucleotidyltransferase domain-containing protein [Pseudomonadota bacterium]
MRLSEQEIAGMKAAVSEVFGPDAVVRLFGSRVDDARRGGDIDLLVELGYEREASDGALEARAPRRIEDLIGDLKADLIVIGPDGPRAPIERIALTDGVRL